MTGRERYLAMLRGARVDHVPRTPILMHFAAAHIRADYAGFAAEHHVLVEANLRCAADFGFDQVSCISDPFRETHGFGARIEYVRDGVPRCTRPLADAKDLGLLHRPDPLRSARMADRVAAVRLYHDRLNHDTAGQPYSILGWIEGPASSAANLRGVQQFLIDLLRDPPFAAELMDLCAEVAIEFGRVQIAAGADTLGIGDAIASQVSPALYERLILPREKRVVRAIQHARVRAAGGAGAGGAAAGAGAGGAAAGGAVRHGSSRAAAGESAVQNSPNPAHALVKLHICGDITHLLPGIAELGVDILDVDHMVDLAEVRRRVGGRVALTGNLDPVSVVLQGKPKTIRARVRDAYARAGNPYLVNAGCEVPLGTPAENLRALCKPVAWRE
ncbi:MAG: uroporphyrinogen decarboxylase family protein [Planctomycetota bacterium]